LKCVSLPSGTEGFLIKKTVADLMSIGLFIHMTSEQLALNILMCALRYRQKQVIEIFGPELDRPLFYTLAELHKDHPDKQDLVYVVASLIKDKHQTESGRFVVNPDLKRSDVLTFLKSTEKYRSDQRNTRFTDEMVMEVLEDFTAIMQRKLKANEKLLNDLTERFQASLK
jgi:predicted YcjX-like family ATPase